MRETEQVGGPQISGKVFRFLSAMHPALSKSERKRYAGYDPEKWYTWTPDLSAEFTELMRRSPRDTSFARGFAYVAQRAIPEGQYVPTGALLDHLGQLPGAYRGPEGSGFEAAVDRPGHAVVRYFGLPGFTNVCIAVQGELVQRMQSSGAHSVVVKHRPTCRLDGENACEFDVEWSGESPPAEAKPARMQEIVMSYEREIREPASPSTPAAREVSEPAAKPAYAAEPKPVYAAEPMRAAAAAPAAQSSFGYGNGGTHAHAHVETVAVQHTALDPDLASSEDLFVQLRKRLAEADRQARLYADAQQEIDRLRVEISRMRAQAEAEVAQAEKERNETAEALSELKRRIRAIVGDS
jgi:hypothetical protein